MIRNRLRTLEQQLNAAEVPEDLKLRLQAYVTGRYGSLLVYPAIYLLWRWHKEVRHAAAAIPEG